MKTSPSIDLSSYPKTTEEWWMWLEHDWNNILEIIKKFTKNKKTIIEITKCKETKNSEITKYLDLCWSNIPDDGTHTELPGWFVFSELISESDLLERDLQEQKQANGELFRQRYRQLNTDSV
jgi:hypothetical protein